MRRDIAAVINSNIVERIIVIEPCAIPAIKESYGYEHLIPVDDNVQIGDFYDSEKSIFLRDGVRVYPQKTDSERIAELETQISELQDALIEVVDIVAMSDNVEDGGTDG